ncbi:MAG: hypothetical protein EOO13_12615 [Chitinophagaceae bacterium]|nr:MAG: hypothetical protein EOO13_12615 [Chitinophagaceae bacterium]
MPTDLSLLLITAISIAFLHTAAGPDHYLPFVALSKSGNWTYRKTIFWTMVCGAGHILSSVALGLAAGALGWSLSKLHIMEGMRGSLAGWGMFVFGLGYSCWGLINLYRNKPHKHFDLESSGDLYVFEHRHQQSVAPAEKHKVTPWVMFIIFLLGPCEPMIPLLYVPAAQSNWTTMFLMIASYSIVTLSTMLLIVSLGYFGLGFIRVDKLNKYIHVIGGISLLLCGAGMLWLGL